MKRMFFFTLLLFLACRKNFKPALDAQDEYQRAFEFYEKKNYSQAIEGFQRIIFTYPGSEYADDAQFYLAKAYYGREDYLQATLEFEFLIKNFAHSLYQEESALFKALAYYKRTPSYQRDQTLTKRAIELLEEFLATYPQTKFEQEARKTLLACREKLAKKEFENGKLYMKLKEFDAAEIYFKSVNDNYPEASCAREAKFWLAESFYRRRRLDEAKSTYGELLNENDQWKKKAENQLGKIGEK